MLQDNCIKIIVYIMVEARGVEPLSEGSETQASPSAVSVLTFPPSDSH